MRFEELDLETRHWMVVEFNEEEARWPYRSPSLSPEGRQRFPALMTEAISEGDVKTLTGALRAKSMWSGYEPSPQGGVRPTDPDRAARDLARSEFNTWYVRGLCRRLMEEGEELLQVYRADDIDMGPDECDAYENMVLEIRFVYHGHRAKYRPRPNPQAFSIPSGVNCKHSVRRIPADMKAMLELEERQFGAAFRRP